MPTASSFGQTSIAEDQKNLVTEASRDSVFLTLIFHQWFLKKLTICLAVTSPWEHGAPEGHHTGNNGCGL